MASKDSQAVPNPAGLRLRLEHLLSTANLEAAGLPPQSILIVRRLHDPLPGELLRDASSVVAPARWQHAARAQLDTVARSASYPADQFVPASAHAVIFRDQAELLACLAMDIVQGTVRSRWWWSSWKKYYSLPINNAIEESWSREPLHIAGALSILDRMGDAVRVVSTLQEHQATRLLSLMTAASASAALVEAVRSQLPTKPGDILTPQTGTLAHCGPDSPLVDGTASPRMHVLSISDVLAGIQSCSWFYPGERWLQVLLREMFSPHIGRERALLIAAGLLITRRPHLITNSVFQQFLHRWYSLVTASPKTKELTLNEGARKSLFQAPPTSQIEPKLHPPPANSPLRETPSISARQHEPEPNLSSPSDSTNDEMPGQQDDMGSAPGRQRTASPTSQSPLPSIQQKRNIQDHKHTLQKPEEPGSSTQGEIATGLAGVFFLINPLAHLGLLGIEQPDSSWSATGWEQLELAARYFALREHAGDPLWAALATLAGRDAGDALPVPKSPQPVDHPLQRLAEEVSRMISIVEPECVSQCVLQRSGRLFLTSSHVDVVMPLADVSLRIRKAGLDFDPGWVPALGRVVQFHYI
ncbi:MAG: hypothetical protein U0R19_27765 [Bryobacteraceae bacterium]